MKVAIRRLGNSQGVIIPKPILAQVGLVAAAEMRVDFGPGVGNTSVHEVVGSSTWQLGPSAADTVTVPPGDPNPGARAPTETVTDIPWPTEAGLGTVPVIVVAHVSRSTSWRPPCSPRPMRARLSTAD